MGIIQRMVMMTAAQHRVMVFFPNRTIAMTERENAAKFQGLATASIRHISIRTFCIGSVVWTVLSPPLQGHQMCLL